MLAITRAPLVRAFVPSFVLMLAACGPTSTQPSPTSAPAAPTSAPAALTTSAKPTQPATAATSAPAAATAAPAAGQPTQATAGAAPAGTVRLNLAPDGSRARFRVREQLARLSSPTEAIGTTSGVSGSVGVGPNGIVPEASKIMVRLDSLATDQQMRDRFIKMNTLQTQQFPTAEFQAKQASGLPWPLPTSGEMSFQLTGDLTLHGVTQSKTWDIKGQFAPNEVSGSGTTSITLDQFGMEKPRVASVLSIEDTIVLEIDFKATQNGG